MAASIEIRDLTVVRGGREALSHVALDVAAGRVTGVLGPSGSGKTTLMRCIVGVQLVAAGEVRVLGRPAGDRDLRRLVAYMTQAPSVYPDLSVRENLGYFGQVLGVDDAETRRVAGTVDLAQHLDQVVATLSGGERTRASLAVALLGDPQVLVLDEPTVGLDPVLRRDLWQLFRRLAAEGRTLLVSSHVMDEADRCDDLVLLRGGRVLATSTPAELRRRSGREDLSEAFLAMVEGRPPG